MSTESISDERLDAVRRLDLDALLPASKQWTPATRRHAARWLREFAPILTELVNEIDALDGELAAADDEIEQLKAGSEQSPSPTTVSVRQTLGGRWQAHWREAGVRRSRTFATLAQADSYAEELTRKGQIGGAR